MKIEIRLFATLAPYAHHRDLAADGTFHIKEPATILDVVSLFGVPEEEIKLVFLNGVRASLDSPLKHGDRVGVFPPIGGG